jgi:hypothetical protein
MAYTETRYDFEQCLSKTCPVMCIVQLREAEQCTSNVPLAIFFDPRTGHREVSITVGGLPRITRQAYFSLNPVALE